MATTNFLEWNPTEANQESDAVYLTDTQRLNGIAVDDIMPSARMNKMFRQWSVMVAALAQMLVNNGVSTSDVDTTTLATTLQVLFPNIAIFTRLLVVAFSPTPTFDCSAAWKFYMSLTGNITSMSVINASPGTTIVFAFQQDGVGGRTVAWPGNVLGGGDVFATASAYSTQTFEVGVDSKLHARSPVILG